MNLLYCKVLIKLAQLSSKVARRLSSVQAFRDAPERIVRTVAELDNECEALKRSVESVIPLDDPVNPARVPPGLTLSQTMYLKFTFFNLVLDIHTCLTHPWSRSLLGLTPHPTSRMQTETSIHKVVKTCTSALLATEHIHITASTPVL
jgi:hypothetical protein